MPTWAFCGAGCKARLCSRPCFEAHAKSCRAAPAVAVDIYSKKLFEEMAWALALIGCNAASAAGDVMGQVAIFMPSGKTLAGSQGIKFRSVRRPLGEHRLKEAEKGVKADNNSIFKFADKAVKYLVNNRLVVWLCRAESFAWLFSTS